MQYKFRLDKMHCAGCALALEQNINTIDGVEAKISFVTKVIELNIETDNPAETLTEVKVAIKKFDHMVEILPYEEELDEATANKYQKIFDLSRFAIAILLMISNIFISTEWIKIANFAVAYVIVAYEVFTLMAHSITSSLMSLSSGQMMLPSAASSLKSIDSSSTA